MVEALLLASLALRPDGLVAASAPRESPCRTVGHVEIRAAVEKSLGFLEADIVKWRKKTDCATCHHGAMTVLAYNEAKRRGYSVPHPALRDTLDWTKARFVPAFEEKPNLANGFEIPSLSIPILAVACWTSPETLSADETDRMAKYLIDRQQADGGWALQQRNPHPVFESREVLAAWYALGLEPAAKGTGRFAGPAREARQKAQAFLSSATSADTTQAEAMRLLVMAREKPRDRLTRRLADALLIRQNPDGGWSQTRDLRSDAYATGQALYALSVAGVRASRKEMARGVSFLVSTQREDGSWPMIPRETPERKPSKNLEPIVHFAAAWAVMGLARVGGE